MAHEGDEAKKEQGSRFLLTEIAKGMGDTLRHILRRDPYTMQYPEQVHVPREGYRGEHYLTRDEDGHVKCVACFMCAAACPSLCIHIEGGPTPPEWKDREKYPLRFEIDLLECIYCGMCEEACPVDAIRLSTVFNLVSTTRQEKVYDRDKLLENGEKLGLSLSRHRYRPDNVPGHVPEPE